jgi:hypothetical protein
MWRNWQTQWIMRVYGEIKHINNQNTVRGRSPQSSKGTGSSPVIEAN